MKIVKYLFLGVLGLFAFILIISVVVAVFTPDSVKKEIANEQAKKDSLETIKKDSIKKAEQESEMAFRKENTFAASQLNNYYQNNEVKADAEMKGKTVFVDGVVDKISKNFADEAYLLIRTGNDFQNLHCEFKDQSELMNLSPGQKVSFKGQVNGMIMGGVMMKDCVLLPPLK